jgi:hypothetical protein
VDGSQSRGCTPEVGRCRRLITHVVVLRLPLR